MDKTTSVSYLPVCCFKVLLTIEWRMDGFLMVAKLVTCYLLSYIEILYLGFLIVGNHPFVVGIVGMIIVAMQNPATEWVTPPGRMIVSILENGLLIPTVLFLVLFIYGLYILLTEKND